MSTETTYYENLAERLLLRAGALSEELATRAARANRLMLEGANGRDLVDRSASIALLTEAAVALISDQCLD